MRARIYGKIGTGNRSLAIWNRKGMHTPILKVYVIDHKLDVGRNVRWRARGEVEAEDFGAGVRVAHCKMRSSSGYRWLFPWMPGIG